MNEKKWAEDFFLNSKNKSVTIKGANRINVPKVLNSGTDNKTEMLKRKKEKKKAQKKQVLVMNQTHLFEWTALVSAREANDKTNNP